MSMGCHQQISSPIEGQRMPFIFQVWIFQEDFLELSAIPYYIYTCHNRHIAAWQYVSFKCKQNINRNKRVILL